MAWWPACSVLSIRCNSSGDKPADSSSPLISISCCAGQQPRPGSACQGMTTIAATLGVVPAFETRCGAAQNHRALFQLSPLYGDIAGGVAQPVLLYEGSVVLLVDDQQTQSFERHKYGRSGAEDDGCTALAGGSPCAIPLGITHPRVECDNRRCEAGFET